MDGLFAEKFASDDREPAFAFAVPELFGGGLCGLLMPSPLFWTQMGALLAIQAAVNSLLAVIVYQAIIQKRGRTISFLTGFGVVIPLVLILPYHLISMLDLQNICVIMSIVATPVLIVPRCLEAMYGFSPPSVEASLNNYVLYYSYPIQFLFDPKTDRLLRCDSDEIRSKGTRLMRNYLLLGLMYSVLEPRGYQMFFVHDYAQPNFLGLAHIGNNFMTAVLTYLCLDTGTLGFGLAVSALAGISTLEVTHNPIFASSSVSDFWGRRWNVLVGGVLKRGIFKPVRKHFPREIAAIFTFVASGLMHEYVISIIALKKKSQCGEGDEGADCYEPAYGNHLAFFLWNCSLLLIENSITKWRVFEILKKMLPPPAVTALVLLTVLPISHWFTDEYVSSGFYSDYKVGFPVMVTLGALR